MACHNSRTQMETQRLDNNPCRGILKQMMWEQHSVSPMNNPSHMVMVKCLLAAHTLRGTYPMHQITLCGESSWVVLGPAGFSLPFHLQYWSRGFPNPLPHNILHVNHSMFLPSLLPAHCDTAGLIHISFRVYFWPFCCCKPLALFIYTAPCVH